MNPTLRAWPASLLLSLGLTAEPAPEVLQVTPAAINQMSEELRAAHPALHAARAQADAARAEVAGVRTWADPMLRLGGMFAEDKMRAEEGDLVYGIEQKLPLFGRPRLTREIAQADLATEEASVEYLWQTLRRDLAQALFRTALVHRKVAIGQEDLVWLGRMVQLTEQRYRTGDSTLVDLLRLQNEHQIRADRLRTDQRQLDHEQLILNRLLNRELTATWPALELPAIAGPVRYTAELVDLALRFEPGLRVRRHAVQQAEARAQLVRRERLPDLYLGAQGRNYSGNGDFRQAEVMLGFSFPWGNAAKYRADRERSRARTLSAEQETADYALDLQEEVHLLTVQIDAARREALLYQDEIVPRSERALESALAAWTANRGLFLDVLDARRLLLEARLRQVRAVTEQYDRLSELVLCCGIGDLEALEMLDFAPDP